MRKSIELACGVSKAIIDLNLGASLQSLTLQDRVIFKPIDNPLETFASSILFPFVNRIRDGKYSYNSRTFQLKRNMPPNAIHGLVFNKEFSVRNLEEYRSFSKVELIYSEKKRQIGFPFLYSIMATYTLTSDSLKLKLSVKNEGDEPFPFSLGWHPYFYTSNRSESQLSMEVLRRYLVDDAMIPIDSEESNWSGYKTLKGVLLDDGFKIRDNKFKFKTPDYNILCKSSYEENFVQVFTPKDQSLVAIEPMTSPADSFNNKIGLKKLMPKEIHDVVWELILIE